MQVQHKLSSDSSTGGGGSTGLEVESDVYDFLVLSDET